MNYSKVFTFLAVLIGLILISLTYGNSFFENTPLSFESFILLHFMGYLFFLLMPVEGIFLYYLTEGYSPIPLLIAAILSASLGQLVDYLIGKLVNEKFARDFVGKIKYKNFKSKINKYGSLIIFIFSVSLLPSSIIAFLLGVIKSDWKRVYLYSLLGLTIKYVIVLLFFTLF
jgi:membrane protein YqaA with SNARE-associated domain